MDSNFIFDMLMLPPVGSDSPIVILDLSVTDPYHSNRISKYKNWKNTVIPLLKLSFPSHDVVCVTVWPENYTLEKASERIKGFQDADHRAALDNIYLLEQGGMDRCVEINFKEP